MLHLIRKVLKPFTISHLAKPSGGFWGSLTVRFMKSANSQLIMSVLQSLSAKPGEKILDVGFGHGDAMCHLLESCDVRVWGADYSQTCVDSAAERFAQEIKAGRVSVDCCSVDSTPFPDGHFDGIIHANCWYFWPDLQAGCNEIFRINAPGGRMVAGSKVKIIKTEMQATAQGKALFLNSDVHQFMKCLKAAGYSDVKLEEADGGGEIVIARKDSTGSANASSDGAVA